MTGFFRIMCSIFWLGEFSSCLFMQGLEYPADSPLELDMVPAEPEAEVQQQQQQQQQQQVSLI